MTENLKKFKQLKHLEARTKKEYEVLADEKKTYEGEIANLRKYIKRLDEKKKGYEENLNTHLNYTLFYFKASDIKTAFSKLLKVKEEDMDFSIIFHKAWVSSDKKLNVCEYLAQNKSMFVSIYADKKSSEFTSGMCFSLDLVDFLNRNKLNLEFVSEQKGDCLYVSSVQIKKGREKDLVLIMNGKYLMEKDPKLVNALLEQDALSAKKKPATVD